MLASLALLIALAGHPTTLVVSPWTGGNFSTSVSSAASKSRLTVTGKPGSQLLLRAKGVANGWIPAFCTANVCAPMQVSLRLPKSGVAVFQFELIRESQNAPSKSGATIVSNDGATAVVPAAAR